MPGCAAMRPGDIVKAMNGKSIQIQSTDTAGRLCLADALVYAQNFWPRSVLELVMIEMLILNYFTDSL